MKIPGLVMAACLLAAMPLRAETPRPLGAAESLATGDVISIVSINSFTVGLSGSWLEGRRGNQDAGILALTQGDRGAKSATRWRVQETAPDIYSFQCLGIDDGPMWLDGNTIYKWTRLVLSPNGVSGASWALYREGTGFNIKCLGKTKGSRWLSAAAENKVMLVPEPESAPALWQVYVWKKAAPPAKAVTTVR